MVLATIIAYMVLSPENVSFLSQVVTDRTQMVKLVKSSLTCTNQFLLVPTSNLGNFMFSLCMKFQLLDRFK